MLHSKLFLFRFECGILRLLIESGLNCYSFLAVRALARLGPGGLADVRPKLERGPDEKGGLEREREVYSSQDFRNIYNLVAQVREN